ncbi:DUF4173 domain-containing protein [Bifidobacterium felsineum]|uniref:Uncharacterized protein n=1 Tax=Bifidobacterium felsineum TaxID=2045440 RepID=A0A2M9HJY1_9BIFI|nr:DUF4173 domain-containing protein [Bifidobacterium felsineum]MBT1165006.1 DUF4173 domain-containing protein [Bifidobacterium felsineum]PJM77123.1 hypothetical protein CSQ86_04260 [Bifidobacterium felsineum]
MNTEHPATQLAPPTHPMPQSRTLPPIKRRLTLLTVALLIPFAFDRLMLCDTWPKALSHVLPIWLSIWARWSLLCIICLTAIVALFVKRAYRNPVWWLSASVIGVLSIWLIVNDDSFTYDVPNHSNMFIALPSPNYWYATLTSTIVLPALLMLTLQLSATNFAVHRPANIVLRWLQGWTINLFTHWRMLAQTCSQYLHSPHDADNDVIAARNGVLRKIGIALLISLPILCLLIPLLMQADAIFSYGVTHMFDHIDLTVMLWHTIVVLIPFPFLASLLASVEMRNTEPELTTLRNAEKRGAFDPTITTTVMMIVLALYAVFCTVQFTFLFAGAGLPAGYTYAEYARQGFFQLLFVATLNLAGFGLVLTFTSRTKLIVALQIGLLAATGVMLASSAMRLWLYIDAYGLTWLRWLSLTFIVLLAAVLMLSLIRLFVARLPLMTAALILLLLWWLALGLSNPDRVVNTWNTYFGTVVSDW